MPFDDFFSQCVCLWQDQVTKHKVQPIFLVYLDYFAQNKKSLFLRNSMTRFRTVFRDLLMRSRFLSSFLFILVAVEKQTHTIYRWIKISFGWIIFEIDHRNRSTNSDELQIASHTNTHTRWQTIFNCQTRKNATSISVAVGRNTNSNCLAFFSAVWISIMCRSFVRMALTPFSVTLHSNDRIENEIKMSRANKSWCKKSRWILIRSIARGLIVFVVVARSNRVDWINFSLTLKWRSTFRP